MLSSFMSIVKHFIFVFRVFNVRIRTLTFIFINKSNNIYIYNIYIYINKSCNSDLILSLSSYLLLHLKNKLPV